MSQKIVDTPKIVLDLLGAAEGQVAADDLNGREAYYHYIAS